MHDRIRRGEPGAFRELFDAHAGLVYRHAARVTGDRSLAEDVVSLTFLEAWRLRERLRDEGDSPRPWLMGIAVNVLRNTARAARRHERALARVPVRDTLPDFATELVSRMADAEQLAAAKAALGKLRRSEREVVTLCVWSGLSYPEAAEALGVPVGTVRSRLSRARDRLRKLAERELRENADGAARRGPPPGPARPAQTPQTPQSPQTPRTSQLPQMPRSPQKEDRNR
ncbi:RNA polymerase sigma factor [Streptomyces sp. HU2014]|uniref:RNA polymerase n=1 Tax=Streptomyces albireticuli TaxID=1940 RepID=A0A1Z2L7L0_9ACTN|nr:MULTISPECIES: RNA polymerase sigma factor [Streptomyces]ARZ70294.1 RNA polymerase [Streptomyces albireticuli]UQI43833.1 RNA polymerase sigma factor [Streptomyces sp. HU2014]